MSFPRYPAYKPSGVEWLGEVPVSWEVRKVRRIFEIKKRIAGELGFDILSITQQGFRARDLDSNDGQVSMDYSKYQLVEPGDFAMNHMDLLTGFVDITSRLGVTSPDYRVFSLSEPAGADPRYLLHIFQMGYRQKILYAYGQGSSQLGRWRLPTDEFQNWAIPYPSLEEQRAIATFLDRETAKIDALIAEQQRLIELLQEKRQAVISHAVTKGLNPDTPMKDSGVEWLGEVPEHWEVTQLKYFSKSLPGFAFPSDGYLDDDSKWKLLRGVNVGVSSIRWDDAVYWEREPGDSLDRYELSPGDLVVGLDRPLIKEGLRVARINPEDCPCMLLQRVAAVKGVQALSTDYLFYLLSSPFFVAHFEPETTGVNVPHISTGQIDSFVVPIPPTEEQAEIVRFLSVELAGIQHLIEESKNSTEILQERRSALLSAAVTGQIDVRGLVPEAEAA